MAVHFSGEERNEKVLFKAWHWLRLIMIGVVIAHVAIMLAHLSERRVSVLYRGSRILLILVSLGILINFLFRKTDTFQRYIIAGSLIFLVSGTLAFLSNILRYFCKFIT